MDVAHVLALDERLVVGVDVAPLNVPPVEPVGEAARVEAILEAAVPLVVGLGHRDIMRPALAAGLAGWGCEMIRA